jgi:hypothetical protein
MTTTAFDEFLDEFSEAIDQIGMTNPLTESKDLVPVDLETFLYDPDYLNLSPDPNHPVRLSKKQLEFLQAMDDITDENPYQSAVIKWGKGCLSGDSVIEDINGNKYTIKELECLYSQGKKIKIWSYNDKLHHTQIDNVLDVFVKGDGDLYDVELENGKKIQVTMEHKFLTQNGWKALKNIKAGDEIFCE